MRIRHILVLALLAACPVTARAQGLEVGVRGGATLSRLQFDVAGEAPSTSSRIGLTGGVFVRRPVLRRVDLQVEALYAQKGTKVEESGVTSSVWLDYLDVPVLARVAPRRGSRFYLVGGGSFAVRVRARTRTPFGGATEEIDIADEVTSTDLGLVAGGGVEFGRLIVDGRYTHGLSDIDHDTSDDVSIFNRVVSITAGVKF